MTLRRAIEILEKRRWWLDERIRNDERDLTYDKAERSALDYALPILEDELVRRSRERGAA